MFSGDALDDLMTISAVLLQGVTRLLAFCQARPRRIAQAALPERPLVPTMTNIDSDSTHESHSPAVLGWAHVITLCFVCLECLAQ